MNKFATKNGFHSSRGSTFMLFLVVYNILLTLAFSLIFTQIRDTPYASFFYSPWFSIISQALGFLVPLCLWPPSRVFVRNNIPRERLGFRTILLIIALCLCLQPALMLLSALTSLVFPNPVADLFNQIQSYPFVVSLVAFAITPAICEELVCRGYILPQYADHGIKKAALLNGLFFAILHMNAQQFAYAFVMGVLFAYLVYRTRSIYAGMLAHFCINALQLCIDRILQAVLIESAVVYEAEAAAQSELASVMFVVVLALAFLPVALLLLRALFKPSGTDDVNVSAPPDSASDASAAKTPRSGGRMLDPCFWGVIVVYVLYMLITWSV